MARIDRRSFLRHTATLAAGGVALASPMRALVARAAQGAAAARDNAGYGPLVPVPDKRDGVVRLHLPKGFVYRSFGETGEIMTDGAVTPGRQDGMAAFRWRRGRLRVVRNHEINGPGPAFGSTGKAYDPMARGGTSTLELSPHAEDVASWVSMNGTQMNCAGGPTPWGTWITCEETVNGPDVGNDFTGGDNTLLEERHGYIFEARASWGPGEHETGVPIRNAGRFAHEALAIDPDTGIVYMTEDDFNFPSGFYRYIPPTNPLTTGRLADGGALQMLRIPAQPGIELKTGQSTGITYQTDWVAIDEPDTTFPSGTTNDEAIQFVSGQGFAQGAAKFSRLEGIFHSGRRMFLNSTQGGDAPGDPGGGYGDGFGQVWAYALDAQTLTLVFESPSQEVLDLPDNMTVSPRGSLLLCEDGAVDNFLRGLTEDGAIFDFALNAIPGREKEEFAGATFDPGGQTLFVNIQASSGLTFAIWGPWSAGPL